MRALMTLLAAVLLLRSPPAAGAKKTKGSKAESHLRQAKELGAEARTANLGEHEIRALLSASQEHVEKGLLANPKSFGLLTFGVNNLNWRGWGASEPGRGVDARADLCDRAREVFTDNPKAALRSASAKDSRYTYIICCDEARRLDGADGRRECFAEALGARLWAREWQYPATFHEGLAARPWWKLAQLGRENRLMLQSLQKWWPEIRREALAASSTAFRVEPDRLFESGEWTELALWVRGEPAAGGQRTAVGEKPVPSGCELMPKTCALLDDTDGLKEANRRVAQGAVKLSNLAQGTVIKPHCAPVNDRIRIHLPLVVPKPSASARTPHQEIGIRVGGEARAWTEGELMAFDDSFEHEVWHRGEEDRLVLIIDIPHPDLEEEDDDEDDEEEF